METRNIESTLQASLEMLSYKKILKMEFKHNNRKISEQNLANFKDKYKLDIPQDYANFLLEYNGGQTIKNKYPSESGTYLIHEFYSVLNGSLLLEDCIESIQIVEQTLPDYLLPFAIDEGGNQFCIGVKPFNWGKIHIYYLDIGDSDDSEVYLDNSFESFISKLRENW